ERAAHLADGERLAWDRLVLATGSRPALPPIARLQRAGVHALRPPRDAQDIAGRAARRGHAPGAGRGLLGPGAAPRPQAGATPATTLKVMGVELFCAGRPEAAGEEDEVLSLDSRAGRYRKLIVDGDRLVGALLLGDLAEVPALHELIEHGGAVPDELLDGAP